MQRILDAMTAAPAFVRNGRMDLLAANRLGYAFYSQHFDSPHGPANSARFIFLDPRAMFVYTAEVGSKSEEALNLLVSWTATLDQAEAESVTDEA